MRRLRKILFYVFVIYLITIFCRSVSFNSKYNALVNLEYNKKNDYPIIFDYNKDSRAILLDSNNIFCTDYSKMRNLGVKNQFSYNPVTISLNSLRTYQSYLIDSNLLYRDIFFSNSNWLCNNIGANGCWKLMHDKLSSGHLIEAPWPSALSQGLGISVLVRAYKMTNDSVYLFSARKALLPFGKTIKEGGVRTNNKFGVFYEEYPLDSNSTHVLNGFIYSLYGLYDLWQLDNNLLAKKYFEDGVSTLKTVLPLYDLGNWTRYDLDSNKNLRNHWGYCSPWYQKLHAAQTHGLYLLTGDKIFADYSDKFKNQEQYSVINFLIYPAYVLYTDFVFLIRKLR